MKKILFLMVTLACMSCGQAYADYSFTFSSNDSSYGVTGILSTPFNGNGPITVTGGSVTGTGAVNSGIVYSLVPTVAGGSIRPFGATDLIFDNQLSPGSSTVLDDGGLVFKSTDGLSYLNIWGNGNATYTLFQLGLNATTHTEIYGPQVNGAASATATPTPIPVAAWLFGSGLLGLVGIRRKQN